MEEKAEEKATVVPADHEMAVFMPQDRVPAVAETVAPEQQVETLRQAVETQLQLAGV